MSTSSSPEAVEALLVLGDDPARNVRAAALVGLGRASAPAAIVPLLVKRLGDEEEEVSYAAALGLERLGPAAKAAAEALGEALGKGKPVQDHVILSALETLGADAVPALAALKRYLGSGATENPSEYRLAHRSKALVERLGKAR